MIIIAPMAEGQVIAIRLVGILHPSTFGAFSRKLATEHDGLALRVFLDWTGLRGWKTDAELRRAFQQWNEVSQRIKRAAIVHRACWNRHAALLAAILRNNGCTVRSWPHEAIHEALQWLNESAGR